MSDDKDKCPQSLFSDLVDKYGCKVSTIKTKATHNFDISTALSQTKGDDYRYISSSIGLTYFYSNFALSFSNSYYEYELLDYDASIKGQGDYILSLKYKINLNKDMDIYIKSGATIASEDYENKNIDIFLNISSNYNVFGKLSVFTGWTYTFMNNNGNNYYSFNLGNKYKITPSTHISFGYSQTSPSLEDDDEVKLLDLSTSYFFQNGIYSSLAISQELKDNPSSSTALSLGYFF